MFNTAFEVIKGWSYLIAYITGGNFVRKAQLRHCGNRVKIAPTAFFKFPEHISIGDNSFINHRCCVWASPNANLFIGNDVIFGPGVTVVCANHGIAAGTLIRMQNETEQDVWIGNDVWLGANVVVTPGVTIGNGCVVGASAVVTHDLPPNSICMGVPAKKVSERK